jgi:hypothetical protein
MKAPDLAGFALEKSREMVNHYSNSVVGFFKGPPRLCMARDARQTPFIFECGGEDIVCLEGEFVEFELPVRFDGQSALRRGTGQVFPIGFGHPLGRCPRFKSLKSALMKHRRMLSSNF